MARQHTFRGRPLIETLRTRIASEEAVYLDTLPFASALFNAEADAINVDMYIQLKQNPKKTLHALNFK